MIKTYPKSESWLMKVINVLLIIITFGKQNRFMTDYITTIGEKIYVPDHWKLISPERRDCILVHENVHVKQYQDDKFGFFLKYLFWPLPVLHAHARLEYEIEAYATEIVYSYRTYETPVLTGQAFDNVISQLSGPAYFWTCTNKAYITKRLTHKILEILKKTR
jgi:hypothetical protein